MIFKGLLWLAEELRDRAEGELYDEEGVHRELADAYRALETHAISEEEFATREAKLMERLEVIEARRRGGVRRRPRARAEAR